MVQLYIKYTDDNYYLLDLEESEAINFKLTVKDLNDITKVFSPFTQSFKLVATDKNKFLCGFVGNEKIERLNNDGVFDSLLYISGFLFQSGKISFDASSYELKEQQDYKTNFASNLTSLTDRLGDKTIHDIFKNENGLFDPLVNIEWNPAVLQEIFTSIKKRTLSNDVDLKYGIPFISNNRVWGYDTSDLEEVDNIAYNPVRKETNHVSIGEIRPAVSYMSIMNHLLLMLGQPVICPLFVKKELTDLMVWCSNESLVDLSGQTFLLQNYTPPLVSNRYDEGDTPPATPKWVFTLDSASGIFNVQRTAAVLPDKWGSGFTVSLKFNNLVSLESDAPRIKVSLRNNTTGVIIDSQETNSDGLYSFLVLDEFGGNSQLDSGGQMDFSFEILPLTVCTWTSINFRSFQQIGYFTTRAKFEYTCVNNSSAATLGGNSLNLITSLPKMKCTDFLKSFFNTFNISVVSTGLPDGSMYWLTPSDIAETNKPYSKRIVDYTTYVDIATYGKKKANDYNQYVFKHKDSKYYDSLYGDGTKFGSLVYPSVPPSKPTKFEVPTEYSIIKNSNTFNHPSGVRTCLGFSRDEPTVLDSGAIRYKPVYDEFTLMYLNPKNLGSSYIGLDFTSTSNSLQSLVLEPSFKNFTTGNTLAFGSEGLDTKGLYLNFYKSFIELLLAPNTYKSEFILNLPPNEIFMNFANQTQGESNIPTGFRAQNEIIISEQRYSLVDSSIDLITGKTKITLLNF